MERGVANSKPFFLFKNYVEHVPKEEIKTMVPGLVRGIYILFEEDENKRMNVVYIGRSSVGENQGIGGRLLHHEKTKNEITKKNWSRFSAFEVWQNVSEEVIKELEALILHIYGRDGTANKLNIQKNLRFFRRIRRASRDDWKN